MVGTSNQSVPDMAIEITPCFFVESSLALIAITPRLCPQLDDNTRKMVACIWFLLRQRAGLKTKP
jgi:hypothetical protein